MKLALFDIDETLVNVMRIHREAFMQTMQQVFGVHCVMDELDFSGKRLGQNLEAGAKLKGVSKEKREEQLDYAIGVYTTEFIEHIPEDASQVVLPGVVDLLSFLKEKGFLLGVVTGDTEAVAESILERTGLRDYFSFVVTHDHFKNRRDMVEHAVSKAKEMHEEGFTDIFVIGDSKHDVDSAKGIGTSVAVLTGKPTREELAEHHPDHIVTNLSEEEVKSIFGG